MCDSFHFRWDRYFICLSSFTSRQTFYQIRSRDVNKKGRGFRSVTLTFDPVHPSVNVTVALLQKWRKISSREQTQTEQNIRGAVCGSILCSTEIKWRLSLLLTYNKPAESPASSPASLTAILTASLTNILRASLTAILTANWAEEPRTSGAHNNVRLHIIRTFQLEAEAHLW